MINKNQEEILNIFNKSELNQAQIAKILDVTPAYISKIYNKECNIPDRILKLAQERFGSLSENQKERQFKINKINNLLNCLNDEKLDIFYNFIYTFIKNG